MIRGINVSLIIEKEYHSSDTIWESGVTVLLSNPSLHGREDELEILLGYMADALRGEDRLVLVSGEAGIGKTTLVEEIKKRMQAVDTYSITGRCVPGITVPFFPFQEAFRKISILQTTAPENGRMVASKTVVERADVIFSAKDQEKIYIDALNILKEKGSERPILLILDDLQWSDSSTMQLLYFLARNMKGIRLLVLGTYRTEDLQRKGDETPHPWAQHVELMRRAGVVKEINLKPLGQPEVIDIAEEMLGDHIDPFLMDQVYKESHGNPLFVIETIKMLIGNGSIAIKNEVWRPVGDGKLDIPSTVKEVVIRRLERLSRDEQRIIDCAAVIGERFEPQLIQGSLGISQPDLQLVLQKLYNNHQLVIPEDDRFKFSHETMRRVAYEGISALRRTELHRHIGLQLEERLPQEKRYGELSYHFYNAKEPERCVKYSITAGDEVLIHGGAVEALPYFQRILELAPDTPEFAIGRVHAMERLGDALKTEGDTAKAAKQYEETLARTTQGLSKARLLRKLGECYDPLRLGAGDSSKSMAFLNQAIAIPEIDDDEIGEVCSQRTVNAEFRDDWEDAKRQALLSEEAFRRCGNKYKLAMQLAYNSDVFLSTGEIDESYRMLKDAERINTELNSVAIKQEVDFRTGMIHLHWGNVQEALKYYQIYQDMSQKLGWESAISIVDYFRALLLNTTGDNVSALSAAIRSREYAEKLHRDYLKAGATAMIAHIYYQMNNFDECQKYASNAREISDRLGRGFKSNITGMVHLAQAEAALTRDEWIDSKKLFEESISIFAGCPIGKIFLALGLALYGDALYAKGEIEASKEQLRRSHEIFTKIGNLEQARRCEQALAIVGL